MENELFERAPIHKAYMKMALPVVMGMIVTLVYNLVDTYFIALTGNTDLIAGISICAPLFTLLLAIGDIFGIGGSSVISRILGTHNVDDARKKSTFCFYVSIITGFIFTVVMLALKKQVLMILGATSQTYSYAAQYYSWLILGSVFVIFSLVPSNLLRAEGMSLESMIGSVIGTVVNIILDPVFIFALGLGAAGAAIATVIGYIVTCAFFVHVIRKKSKVLSVDIKILRIDAATFSSVLAIGLPSSITNLMQTIGITLTNRFLQPYGDDSIAIMGIVLKIVNIALLVIVGLAFGGQPLIGYNYGAQLKKRLRKIIGFGMAVTGGTGLVFLAVLSFFAYGILSKFLSDPEMIRTGVSMLRWQLLGAPLIGICLIAIVSFQSTGKATGAFVLSACRQGIVFLPVIFILSAAMGFDGVIRAQFISDIVTTVVAFGLFRIFLWKDVFDKKVV
ncbi:putative efflux protein, MATE family [Butyrivibrio proteoclasticus]|uniref:Multidrug export protein MepA n=1 Tax=Butyrivibrio proteoclasticus TaxID=43305 RepID=A0A1I5UU70_9FIRM|nr:MATE family efflux transporter [Butyrivibrio proteoclasticus]SFP98793.1 putative efflux protein, MATE family [Butyrivibrio proteoclasticus]